MSLLQTRTDTSNDQQTRAGRHDFELHLNGIPAYYTETTFGEELQKLGVIFRKVHKAHGWKYAFVNFDVCHLPYLPILYCSF